MTWSYLPLTAEDRQEMLKTLGVTNPLDLYQDLPEAIRLKRDLKLPAPVSEPELAREFRRLAAANADTLTNACFLGAGAYDHYIPSTVDFVLRRSEFYTAYTQYQPEISQGYLQALWEYQSLICEITGMPVANASMYDCATATAEAAIMSCHALRRQEILVARSVHPHYREVLKTYARDFDFTVKEIALEDGFTSAASLSAQLSKKTACVILQNPNFFGCLENLKAFIDQTHTVGAYFVAIHDPTALALLETPGKLGADIVVGEGQPLGLPLSFGGPYLGFMAATEKLMRKLPGRLIGETVDVDGKRGFVLTLQAREQHIRREKATSNICSNEALCALAVVVYLATLGKQGYVEVARQCLQKAHYAYDQLLKGSKVQAAFKAPFFQEFTVKLKGSPDIAKLNQQLLTQHLIGGLDLGRYYPELSGHLLLAVTENRTKAEIDQLVQALEVI